MERNNHTALLIMDLQNTIVSRIVKDAAPILGALGNALETARANHIPVIYGVIGFREGYPEISPNNKSFSILKNGTMNFDTEEGRRIHPAVAPRPGEIIVTKKRVSTFMGSDLEVVLRAAGIKHIVLTGIATSGVVLSTLREAADKDYILTVLSDCCADADEEVHRVLTTKVFPRQADVMTAGEWHARIAQAG